MNIMLVQVSERTREIGLRMAVGERRCDIRRQFLAEAVALAMAGRILGAAAGCVAAAAVAWNAGWPVLISPEAIILAWGFAGVVGVSFGLYPAHVPHAWIPSRPSVSSRRAPEPRPLPHTPRSML